MLVTPPSPKSHRYVTASPVSGSVEAAPLKLQTRPTHVGVVNTAVGATLPGGSVIVMGLMVTVDVSPYSSRTVRVGVKVPAEVYVKLGRAPVPVRVLPKLHA